MKNACIFTAIVFLPLLVTCAMAADCQTGVAYIINSTEEPDTYKLSIDISNISAGGFCLKFPKYFEIVDCSIPETLYENCENSLFIALTGQDTINLTIICPELNYRETSGIWEDLADKDLQKPNDIDSRQSPFGMAGISAIISVIIAGCLLLLLKPEEK